MNTVTEEILKKNAEFIKERIKEGADVWAIEPRGQWFGPSQGKPDFKLAFSLTGDAYDGDLMPLLDGKRFALVVFDDEKVDRNKGGSK